ncbi:MAG TPA: hypothetical protein DCO75_07455 [Fibrobacteres bacterium]|nr:hypothetical protein [Fibrobacterota bacterium]
MTKTIPHYVGFYSFYKKFRYIINYIRIYVNTASLFYVIDEFFELTLPFREFCFGQQAHAA